MSPSYRKKKDRSSPELVTPISSKTVNSSPAKRFSDTRIHLTGSGGAKRERDPSGTCVYSFLFYSKIKKNLRNSLKTKAVDRKGLAKMVCVFFLCVFSSSDVCLFYL